MKKISNKGNLPKHVAMFAGKAESTFGNDTEFYEMSTIKEFEDKAVEIGYEIIPTLDKSTNRAYLVGFDVTDPKTIITLHSYAKITMYFIEITSAELRQWDAKIRSDRLDQQEDMRNRQEKLKKKREANDKSRIQN